MNKFSATLVAFTALSLTSGCVVYDESCAWDEEWEEDCNGPDWSDGRGDCLEWSEDGECTEWSDDPEDETVPLELSFSPGQAEQGETFPAVVRVAEGDFDFTEVTEVSLYGDADIVASVADAGQLTLILAVPADAETGPVDLVLEVAGGDAELLPDAFSIFPADSGHSALDWTDGECE